MTREEAIARIKDHKNIHKMAEPRAIYISEALDIAIKALEQETCDDAISREDVEECKELMTDINGDTVYSVRMSNIRQLPPVAPQPKIGYWIKMPLIEAGQTYSHQCSVCGRRILITDVGLSEFPYCHCGAKMQEVEE